MPEHLHLRHPAAVRQAVLVTPSKGRTEHLGLSGSASKTKTAAWDRERNRSGRPIGEPNRPGREEAGQWCNICCAQRKGSRLWLSRWFQRHPSAAVHASRANPIGHGRNTGLGKYAGAQKPQQKQRFW
jgi:hypothetical protein